MTTHICIHWVLDRKQLDPGARATVLQLVACNLINRQHHPQHAHPMTLQHPHGGTFFTAESIILHRHGSNTTQHKGEQPWMHHHMVRHRTASLDEACSINTHRVCHGRVRNRKQIGQPLKMDLQQGSVILLSHDWHPRSTAVATTHQYSHLMYDLHPHSPCTRPTLHKDDHTLTSTTLLLHLLMTESTCLPP